MTNAALTEDFKNWPENGPTIGKYRYSDPEFVGDIVNGRALYNKFILNKAYYPLKADLKAFQKAAYMGDHIKGATAVISQGAGNMFKQKELAVAKRFDKVDSFVANDLNRVYAEAARDDAIKYLKPTNAFATGYNFFKEHLPALPLSGIPVMMMAGLTISNVEGNPNEEVVKTLTLWKSDLLTYSDRGHLLISVDHNQDKKVIEKAYAGQREFTLNLLHRIKRDVKIDGGFDPEAFDVEYNWHKDKFLITHDLIPLRDMKYEVEGKEIALKKGERYIAHNTYKYPLKLFKEWAIASGFVPIKEAKHGSISAHYLAAGPL